MTGEPWILFALLGVVGMILTSAIYAVVQSVIARFLVGETINCGSAYFATLLGLPLGFSFVALSAAAISYGRIDRVVGASVGLGGLALIMTAINVLIMRRASGGKLNFIQAFWMQLVPNVLLVAYSIATR